MDFAIAAIACTLAYFMKGLCGFGNTLIYSSIMSFFSDTIAITPVEAVLSLPSDFYVAFRNRKHFQLKLILPTTIMMIIGILIGTFVLKTSPSRYLKLAFGLLVIGLGIEMLLREKAKKHKQSQLGFTLIGLAAGIMSGVFGIGALMTAYMGRTTDTSDSFRGNICAVFGLADTVRLVLYIVMGVITVPVLMMVLKLTPFMILGTALGTLLTKRINEKKTRTVITLMLIVSGISLFLTNLL